MNNINSEEIVVSTLEDENDGDFNEGVFILDATDRDSIVALIENVHADDLIVVLINFLTI